MTTVPNLFWYLDFRTNPDHFNGVYLLCFISVKYILAGGGSFVNKKSENFKKNFELLNI